MLLDMKFMSILRMFFLSYNIQVSQESSYNIIISSISYLVVGYQITDK